MRYCPFLLSYDDDQDPEQCFFHPAELAIAGRATFISVTAEPSGYCVIVAR
jgi:hypothetical protein